MRKRGLHIILVLLATMLLSSCGVNRFVPEGKYFLQKNTVEIEGQKPEFTKSEVSSYITQKPFKVRFPFRFPVWLYYVTEDNSGHGFRHWVNENLSRKPEYFEFGEVGNSTKQMEQYLENRGYFNAKVTSNVEYSNKKAKVTYTIQPSEPYRIAKIDYQIEDTALLRTVKRLERRLPAQAGQTYNAYTLDEQRTTITSFLRNSGYYYFSREYITFEVDSSFNNHTVEISMKIANVEDRDTGELQPHKRYTINKISIYPNYLPSRASQRPTDSATITFSTGLRDLQNTLHFYYHEKPRIRPETFSQMIMILEGRPYRQRQVELTYSALSNLKVIANSSIEFEPVPCDTANLLNCRILLRRANTHSVRFQTEGTNSGGDLGISGSVTYTNRNIFKGAEVLTVSLKGGLETQEVINLGDATEEGNGIFNTSELILNTSIYIPRFLSPIPLKTFARDYQPRTNFSLGGSVQNRYAYSRYIAMSSFGYDWKANMRLQFIITPIYLNFVKVNPIPEFQAILDEENNQRIKDQYTSHFVFGGRYSVIYNTQSIYNPGNYIYVRANLESSGGLLSLFNNAPLITTQDDHHELFGIRYAQFLRADVDFRQYYKLADKTWFVCRQLVGCGMPYGNSYDMPFERSFYSGGSVGMRGWKYRKLGPGSYQPTNGDNNIERIGDIQLELNSELRFPIYNSFNGAVFLDAGNIWNYHANPLLPGGEFNFNTFYKQIAVDAGFGVRLDFNIAVVRVDWAFPLRNPYPDAYDNYWIIDDFNILNTHLSLNIGYPF
ncbi:MAG: BamA/TamA family outer membrane protein [Bacteroidales bacterium]|nr:BamA/TamA family outer membrane protein [Bacteroidales bacterium]